MALHRHKLSITAGVVAAVAYCSWPLGYVTDRHLATTALASNLEAHGAPFSWLFISLDCLSGIAVVVAGYFVLPQYNKKLNAFAVSIFVPYALFGLATATDALIPLNCGNSGSTCGSNLIHLSLDDYLTGIALLSLFTCSLLVALRYKTVKSNRVCFRLLLITIFAFGMCGLTFLANHFSNQPAVFLQHVMLTLTSVLIILIPATQNPQERWPLLKDDATRDDHLRAFVTSGTT